MKHAIRTVLERDVETLKAALRAYPNEASLWALPPGITNSAGTLALHLVGNLQHYIGAQLGATGYTRDRVAEFSDRDVPLVLIESRIDTTRSVIRSTFERLTEADLNKEYPIEVGGIRLRTSLFLVHLVGHTSYHLGQIDYHRRLITGVNRSSGPSLSALAGPR